MNMMITDFVIETRYSFEYRFPNSDNPDFWQANPYWWKYERAAASYARVWANDMVEHGCVVETRLVTRHRTGG